MTIEMKEKYANFFDKVSEILGLNKPVDILRLCAVTDEYLKPIEKRIVELEKENAELKERIKWYSEQICNKECAEVWGELTKAKELLRRWQQANICDATVLFSQTEDFLRENEQC